MNPAANEHRQRCTIRAAGEADAPALQALFAQVIGHAAWLPAAAREDIDFEEASRGETVVLCESPQGRLLGLLSADEPERFVHHLYVAAGWRRRGVGRALLGTLLQRDARPWRLKCVQANRVARSFYAALGWVEVDRGDSGQGPYLVLESPALPARG